jgi:transcriptional regulator with XRE-family HTH domain
MSELIERLRTDFQDEEYRHSYAEECLNTMIATQIKILREQRGWNQGKLAEKTGMKQPRIPLLEDSNYSNWTINTLKRFARAFDVGLTVRFDAFSDVVLDFESLSRESLERPSFKDDSLFQSAKVTTSRKFKRRRRAITEAERNALLKGAKGTSQKDLFSPDVIDLPARKESQSQKSEPAPAPFNPMTDDVKKGGTYAIGVGAAG